MGFEIEQKRVRDEMEIEDEIRRESKRGMVRDEEQKSKRWRDWCG